MKVQSHDSSQKWLPLPARGPVLIVIHERSHYPKNSINGLWSFRRPSASVRARNTSGVDLRLLLWLRLPLDDLDYTIIKVS